jgi:hypothetical protein
LNPGKVAIHLEKSGWGSGPNAETKDRITSGFLDRHASTFQSKPRAQNIAHLLTKRVHFAGFSRGRIFDQKSRK